MTPDYYDMLLQQRGAWEAFEIAADDARKLRLKLQAVLARIPLWADRIGGFEARCLAEELAAIAGENPLPAWPRRDEPHQKTD